MLPESSRLLFTRSDVNRTLSDLPAEVYLNISLNASLDMALAGGILNTPITTPLWRRDTPTLDYGKRVLLDIGYAKDRNVELKHLSYILPPTGRMSIANEQIDENGLVERGINQDRFGIKQWDMELEDTQRVEYGGANKARIALLSVARGLMISPSPTFDAEIAIALIHQIEHRSIHTVREAYNRAHLAIQAQSERSEKIHGCSVSTLMLVHYLKTEKVEPNSPFSAERIIEITRIDGHWVTIGNTRLRMIHPQQGIGILGVEHVDATDSNRVTAYLGMPNEHFEEGTFDINLVEGATGPTEYLDARVRFQLESPRFSLSEEEILRAHQAHFPVLQHVAEMQCMASAERQGVLMQSHADTTILIARTVDTDEVSHKQK